MAAGSRWPDTPRIPGTACDRWARRPSELWCRWTAFPARAGKAAPKPCFLLAVLGQRRAENAEIRRPPTGHEVISPLRGIAIYTAKAIVASRHVVEQAAQDSQATQQIEPLVDGAHWLPTRLVEVHDDCRPLWCTSAGPTEEEEGTGHPGASCTSRDDTAHHAGVVCHIWNATVLVQHFADRARHTCKLVDRFLNQDAHTAAGCSEAIVPYLLTLVAAVGIGIGGGAEEEVRSTNAGHQGGRCRPGSVLERENVALSIEGIRSARVTGGGKQRHMLLMS